MGTVTLVGPYKNPASLKTDIEGVISAANDKVLIFNGVGHMDIYAIIIQA